MLHKWCETKVGMTYAEWCQSYVDDQLNFMTPGSMARRREARDEALQFIGGSDD